jgi:tRNA 2-selenouridine synthase SelU
MNIDLRNISDEFEKEVNRIKKEFDINTNSKAVEHCVVNYLQKLKDIESLKNDLNQTKEKLSSYERRLDNLKDLFGWIMKE